MPALRTVAGMTLLSRIAGLARDAVCSRVFGAGPVWSSFALAFMLPNLFRRLFGEGALSAAFIPEYAQALKRDPDAARRLASAVVGALLLGLGILTLVGEIILFALLEFSSLGETGGFAIRLAMIMLPYMPLVCATAILGGMLQTHNAFAATAAAPILLNVAIIAAATTFAWGLGATLETAAFAVSAAVVLAGVVQLAWAAVQLRRHVRWTRNLAGVGPQARRLFRRMVPVIIGLGALQISTMIDGLIAGWPVLFGPTIALPGLGAMAYPLDEAANSILFFTQRLYQFPLGVFGIALATAVFPALSRHSDEPEEFTATLRRGVRLSLFIGIPAAVGLCFVRTDLAAVVLGGGRFDAAAIERVSFVLLGYAPAIWAYCLSHVLTRAFYARGDTATPMRAALGAVAANVALNLALIWPLAEAGLAWATSISAIGQAAALFILLERSTPGALADAALRGSAIRSFILSAAMAAGLVLVAWLMPSREEAPAWTSRLVSLLTLCGFGAALFLGGAWIAGAPEVRWLLERAEADEPASAGPGG